MLLFSYAGPSKDVVNGIDDTIGIPDVGIDVFTIYDFAAIGNVGVYIISFATFTGMFNAEIFRDGGTCLGGDVDLVVVVRVGVATVVGTVEVGIECACDGSWAYLSLL